MSEVDHVTGADGPGFSPIVASIFSTLLNAIHEGRMQPGDHISDGTLAREFEVSRTPVREAIQRLRDLGLIEASAGRYTRVAVITPEQTAHALVVWSSLYGELAKEVVGRVPIETRQAMARDHDAYLAALPANDYQLIANLTFSFFTRLLDLSDNPILVDGIRRVFYLLRLGSLNLPHAIDLVALGQAQHQLLEAIEAKDGARAKAAIGVVRDIRVPLE